MTGATTTAQGYALTSGEARDHGYNGEARLRYLARAADTDGRVTVFEASGVGPQQGPPLHVHHESDEALLVLEGSVLV
jgi:mannose-6-phosphate isomerase-like protein (cupin superfamily)